MKTPAGHLEKLAEAVIETIKELSANPQQPITPSLLRNALSRRKGFPELLSGMAATSYRDLGPRTKPQDASKGVSRGNDGTPFPSPSDPRPLGEYLKKLKDFRFDLLTEVLDRLSDESLGRASELREMIRYSTDPGQLVDMNPEILAILQTAFREVGGELEQFAYLMLQIGKNLDEMEDDLFSSFSTNRETYQKSKDFNNALEGNVLEITVSVRSAGDLEEMRGAVTARLSAIRESIEKKRRQDEMQLRKANAEIERLRRHIDGMKEELNRVQTEAQSLEKEVLLDPLTGIHNRRAYEKRFREEFNRYRSSGQVFSMLLIDIDHFKLINDQYGHWAGDRCLEELTKLIKNTLRGMDFLARYGGEEFIVLLPGTGAEGIETAAERIRESIERARFIFRNQQMPLTVSIGGTFARPMDQSVEAIFKRMDAALYQAKNSGRNRVALL